MNVPAEEEGCVPAECDGGDEVIPGGVEEELDQRDDLEDQGQEESRSSSDFGEDGEGGIADETSSYTVNSILVDG